VRDTGAVTYAEAARRTVARVRRRWRAAAPRTRRTWRTTAASAVAGLALAGTAVTVSGPWDHGQRTAERARAAPSGGRSGPDHAPGAPGGRDRVPDAPPVLAALGGDDGDGGAGSGRAGRAGEAPPLSPSGLAGTLRPLLGASALGPVRTAAVLDVATGRQVFGASAGRAVTPASTVKLATGAAALAARGPDHRIATRVVDGGEDTVVLVGGGDPTLDEDALDALARRTARAVGEDAGRLTVRYDTSLYTGPGRHSIGRNPNLAPVSPLMIRSGRLDDSTRGPAPRSADPARAAAEEFAGRLEEHGAEVGGKARSGRAPADADTLAVHRSAPLSALVERMLTHSDNDLAEALARQAALADAGRAGFTEGGRAVKAALKGLGLPVRGAVFADGSGLSRENKVPAALLTRLLARAADPARAELRSLLTGLPVAGFTGTLDGRYPDAERGAGLVRAKTGTLTGVNTLAGTVVDAEGRLLAFAFMTTGTTDAGGAQTALDRMASSLAACGCR
jgi:D-alanyl-D-alanine carboxypeptidase/D-alanyl-D-alanine-endopeptidase (penicillin-binding protein 4)